MLGQLGEAEVALEAAVEQRADRRGLEEDVRLPLACRSARRIDSTCSDRIQRSSSISGSLPAGRAARLRLTSENKRSGRATIRSMAAIELRGVVKTFGPITAVDGLDLEVPEGICLGLLGPNGAGKSTTMRLLTGQAVADAGELRVLGLRAAGAVEARPRRNGRRPPARQPRRRRHRRRQPRRLRPALPSPGRRRRRQPLPSTSPACETAAATRSTNSPAGCGGASYSPAASSTNLASSSLTSRPSASIPRSEPSSGP